MHPVPRGHALADPPAAEDRRGPGRPPIGLGNTICALGDAAALPTHSFLMRFRDEFEAHIREHRCPFGDKPWGAFGDWS